ncbi:CobW GTPase involved in cobalt insertion for B12 biosynthesis [hydrothermal vent metagenome]|uniref:CobW GTPase involved in cobalt insertion for B12 biosynthesis n=1 Tax=hydrothermal vent metagenome TaxID=652676 RepID=A0A3B0SZL8_9ZZZZ
MAEAAKIPATVITGFLGAGKTTLIRHLIQNAGGRRIALIVNEFGDIGIDGEVLKACASPLCAENDIVELSNGCICCTVADDFIPTMTALVERPSPPDHIVIETSGLALPQPLVRAFNWPEIRTKVTVDGVVTVVDGAALADGRIAADEAALADQRAADTALDHDDPIEEVFEDQLAAADMIVLTKSDLVADGARTKVRAHLAAMLRPGVAMVDAAHGVLPASVLLGLNAAAETDMAARAGHHDEGEEHEHDDFSTEVIDLGGFADAQTLIARAGAAIAATGLLRLKGFAHIDGKDMRLVVQAVGPRVEAYFDRAWHGGEPRTTRLVAIGLAGFDAATLRAILSDD